MNIGWNGIAEMESLDYNCGYCGNIVASDKGYYSRGNLEGHQARIYICPHCARPTFYHAGTQLPDVSPGNEVAYVPDDVHSLYGEARKCIASSCYTSSALTCRKLLMNIAVTKGADEGLRFIEYIDYLASNGYVPPNGRRWVDHIRKKGNEAAHEIPSLSRDDATELVTFSEMLLKFIYEFPAQIPDAEQ